MQISNTSNMMNSEIFPILKCQYPVLVHVLSFCNKGCYGNNFSWITLPVSGLWPHLTLSMSSQIVEDMV